MVAYNIKSLLRKKSFMDKTKYTYKDIEKATGISNVQLSRLNSTPNYSIQGTHLEKLCNYFNCTPNDLITIYPDENPE